ncbi:CHASE domain-containing protein [Pelagicoccus sp. NFK12]|uniref:histidine kinase n=1 Tax=Pelagicoccus enzymogenes TaxID=2773457 RepID=A0A927F771_9BACT|nr:ATP-binding protein [Pelagicoccus enzymogenes]MBD5778476.1 CHASE domain-containing protein [Pelagicoccus enzymogenes]
MDYNPSQSKSKLLTRSFVQWGAVLVLAVIVIFAANTLRGILRSADLEKAVKLQEEAVLLEANAIRYRLEAETLSSFYLITSLGAYISVNPDLSQEEFSRFASTIFEAKPGLVNIAAAPDLVIRYVYPMKGNEAALGLDYMKHPTQKLAALAVRDSGQPVIAGPLNLVQGGVAVIGRFPVYDESGFWGIVSTPIYLNQLLKDSGLLDEQLSIEMALRGKDGKGAEGDVFFGDPELFSGHSLLIPVQLFSGSWQIGVRPKQGWVTEGPNASLIDFFVIFAGCLVVLISVLLNIYVLRLHKSREVEASVSRAKSRFLATMSHEIRTPLNGIVGVAHLLEMEELDEEQRDLTSTIISSAEALNGLLSDILNLSKLEHGTFVARPEQVVLQEVFEPVHGLLKVEAERKGIALNWTEIPPECSTLVVDPLVLRQVLWNLMSNAVKFTKEGEVRLELECVQGGDRKSEFLRMVVTDTGVGIDKSRQKAVFEDFVQEDDSTTREFGGTGLGLAIVKRLVDGVGGNVSLRSEKGKGSVFTVELPVG